MGESPYRPKDLEPFRSEVFKVSFNEDTIPLCLLNTIPVWTYCGTGMSLSEHRA